ncbi:MAG: hypothetical protein CVU38_01640 [Chloroflexi bacterium HGW-Chloroflexi-1]|nr:MAG: hypothetical protein CVU38_01640 [Chloroflexi bacterium HGW-Chloroflexi-1]
MNADQFPRDETLAQLYQRLQAEADAAYRASPFSALSTDYFNRFSRDPDARPADGETWIDSSLRPFGKVYPERSRRTQDRLRSGQAWKLMLPDDLSPLGKRMAEHLLDFMARCMNVRLALEQRPRANLTTGFPHAITLLDRDGGEPATPSSFTITAMNDRVLAAGRDPAGLRDAVVSLVDTFGLRQAPALRCGSQTFTPKLAVRLGAIPWLGSHKDAVFMGYNAVLLNEAQFPTTCASLYAISTSDAIPELAARRRPEVLAAISAGARAARDYGMKCYIRLDTVDKFRPDDPLFDAHPDIRGSLTCKADGNYSLCTEHPLVRRYLCESVAGLFREVPELDGIVIIVGGEAFYHCYMRPYGVEHGETNCPRCARSDAETVVANLCNAIAEAAREGKPTAEIIIWLYSAQVWSADRNQEQLIARLKPGAAVLTEVEKDETLEKPGGLTKLLWDYSIDMTGLGSRARQQLAACNRVGIPIYFKSEPELSFEAPRLPNVPCIDRWLDRAEALAASGAKGSFVFPAFKPFHATSSGEVYKFASWVPAPDKEDLLQRFAARIAGRQAGPHLREAWRAVSQAIPFSPDLPPYYLGPYYFGPGHPMIADLNAKVPQTFYGKHLFAAESTASDGLKDVPGFLTNARADSGNVNAVGESYRQMERLLARAAAEIRTAQPLVPDRCRSMFGSEASTILWFYHTARTHANFYESCQCRSAWAEFAAHPKPEDAERARALHSRWIKVLENEKENAEAALPLMAADMRLDYYFGTDHTYRHGVDVIRAKLELVEREISEYLPALWRRYEAAVKDHEKGDFTAESAENAE